MLCPYCGKTLERGWLLAVPPILWSTAPGRMDRLALSDVLTADGDLRLRPDETGRVPAWVCRVCGKLMADL